MSDLILWCLVERDYKPFSVICPLTTPIGVLKKLIREEGIGSTSHAVLAKDLTLWKVGTTMAGKSITNSSCRLMLHSPPEISGRVSLVNTCKVQ